jgi:[ribosomal protein S5]-alanine N-acetyltransferase
MTTSLLMTTQRLLLRPLESFDAPLVYEYMQDKEIAANTLLIPYPYPEGAADNWIRGTRQAMEMEKTFTFGIVLRQENRFVGAVGLSIEEDHRRGELGYWLGKRFWGQGYATEASRRMIQFGFEVMNLNRIYATYFAENIPSARVLEKCGMLYEGVLRGHFFKWGYFTDAGLYAITRDDYLNR